MIKGVVLFFIPYMFFFFCCSPKSSLETYNPYECVDPFIGTAHSGDPGATTPWGMLTVSPQNVDQGELSTKENPRFYQDGQKYLYGFVHRALSGSANRQAGALAIMPVFGQLRWKPHDRRYHYSMEAAMPGFYKVKLDEDLIFAEITTTPRTGLSRFRFQNGWAHIIVDPSVGLTNSNTAMLRITAPNEIVGYTHSGLYNSDADLRKLYFVVQFDRTAMGGGLYQGDILHPDTVDHIEGDQVGAVFSFRTLDGNAIQVKVGMSYVSMTNARLNVQTEQPNFSFSLTRQQAREKWTKELSKIRVYGGSAEHARIFYTALYHSLLETRLFQDVNGDYPLTNNETGNIAAMNLYHFGSIWDTYRTVHPLLATFYPVQQLDRIRSLFLLYDDYCCPAKRGDGEVNSGKIGDPAAVVFADSYKKGLHDFAAEKAYEAVGQHAMPKADEANLVRPALARYDQLGYIPIESESASSPVRPNASWEKICGSVAGTLDYAFADWAIAQWAQTLGKMNDYEFFSRRSRTYQNLFDAETGFFRPRLENGEWLSPFDPHAGLNLAGQSACRQVGYCNGSAWDYAFYVPHDIPGLIELLGRDNFVTRLQTLFTNNYVSLDYGPTRTYPFLFNYIDGEAWRTCKTVRALVAEYFDTTPAGVPDADNRAAISAWLVWVMLGLYADCPGSNTYQISTPFFDRIEIDLDDEKVPGNTFVIESKNFSDANITIQSMKLNGKKRSTFTLDHNDLVKGGLLQMTLTHKK